MRVRPWFANWDYATTPTDNSSLHRNARVKAVFQFRVFYTYVHARKSLNPFQYYIWTKQMIWRREFSITYDLACFSDVTC